MRKGTGIDCKLPKGEQPAVGFYNAKHEEVFLMSKKDDSFVLYRILNTEDGKQELKRLGKSKDPVALEEKFDIIKNLGVV